MPKRRQPPQIIYQQVIDNSKINELNKKIEEITKDFTEKIKIYEEKSKIFKENYDFENGFISDDLLLKLADEEYNLEQIGFNDDNLNICFIGRVSSGKSMILNALLELKIPIQTDSNENTNKISYYKYKNNDNIENKKKEIIFWDFPGFGGQKFDYKNNKKYIYLLSIMDCICFIYDGVVDQCVSQTFNFIKNMKTNKIILFNKIDQLIRSVYIDFEQKISKNDLPMLFRKEVTKHQLHIGGITNFLTSAINIVEKDGNRYDWDDFIKFLLQLYKDNNSIKI